MERIDTDVAVIGGGACGVMTALQASRDDDLVVAVFEKSTREGCNTQVSSGSLAAGGTRFQRAAGIQDSPEQHAQDILAASGDENMSDVVHALCRVAPEYVEWIANEARYPIELGTDMRRAGMSVPRLHTDVGRRGGERLMSHLRRVLEARTNVAFVDEAPAVSLVVEEESVAGVTVSQNDETIEVRAETVVLALDGFAANRIMMKEFCSDLGDPFYGGVSTSTGDAIPWLRELGAEFRNMNSCLRNGLVVVGHGTRVSPALPFNGAVLINTDGQRFIDEQSIGYSGLAGVLQQQPGERAAMVWDSAAMTATRESELMRESIRAAAISNHGTRAALALASGLPEATLDQAIRPLHGRRPLEPPYHLAWVTHGVLTTQGGTAISTEGRVLRGDGSTIPGLRAGGGTAAGLAGPRSSGYSSGNGLLSAFGMGWIIGNSLRSRNSKVRR